MKTRYILVLVLFLLCYILIGGTLPYRKNPEVSEEYKQNFSVKDYYGTEEGTDRAKIIIDNGEALKERIRLIDQAQDRIVLSTFSFAADTSGKQMLAALLEAADRGVQIQILADGFNSWINMEGNPYFINLAKHENVEIKIYNKANLFLPWKGMSRLHDKCIVADERVYLVGGRNTFDYFLGDQDCYKNYDTDVLVYNTGGKESSVYEVLEYFDRLWELECCKSWHDKNVLDNCQPSVRRADQELRQIYATMKKEHPDWFEMMDYEYTATVQPVKDEESGRYYFGFQGIAQRQKVNVLRAMQYGCFEVYYWISTTLQSLGKLVTGQLSMNDLSGPVGIVKSIGDTYTQSKPAGFLAVLLNLLNMAVLLSSNLGVMNLLPIPALDGGRLVFFIVEAIRGKKIDPNKEGMVHFVGLVILLAFMCLIMANDIRRLFI